MFHQDNARAHTSLVMRQKLREGLMHPPYTPDLTPITIFFCPHFLVGLGQKRPVEIVPLSFLSIGTQPCTRGV